MKTFIDGAEFGVGTKSSTGLVRLPNAGAVKWRKADGSGDLGMAPNAANHIAMDAVIDFAPGQTFGALTVPDATTTSKGIVQIDPAGGVAVNAGVISLANSGAAPGTYDRLEGAIEKALELGCSDAEAIRYLLLESRLERKLAEKVDTAGLAAYDRPLPTLADYDCLLSMQEVRA